MLISKMKMATVMHIHLHVLSFTARGTEAMQCDPLKKCEISFVSTSVVANKAVRQTKKLPSDLLSFQGRFYLADYYRQLT